MANTKHLEILRQGVKDWNDWRRQVSVRPDLSDVDLSGANLSDADLSWVNLSQANLSSAQLTDASLRGAILNRANLINASFNGADLRGANLCWAKLLNTDFSMALMAWTVLGELDLSIAKGLDTVRHARPSTIGVDTLFRSKGNIPEVFLRGVGLSEDFIASIPSQVNRPIEFYSCFISYSHKDRDFARWLHDALQGRGIRCWLDEKQMLPGDDIFEQIDRGIRVWDKVLLCCSEHSLKSWWVDDEITQVFKKEQDLMKKRRGKKVLALIALNLDGYMFTRKWKSAKATQIKSRLAADFTGWEHDTAKFKEQFELVVTALRPGDAGRERDPKPKL